MLNGSRLIPVMDGTGFYSQFADEKDTDSNYSKEYDHELRQDAISGIHIILFDGQTPPDVLYSKTIRSNKETNL